MRFITGRSRLPERQVINRGLCHLAKPYHHRHHGEDTELEDLTHPEDIEHFKKHEEMEAEEERLEELKKRSVIEENIPAMFLREEDEE